MVGLKYISLFLLIVVGAVVTVQLLPQPLPEVLIVKPSNARFALSRVIHEIHQAKHSIKIATYLLTNDEIIAALKLKELSGVKVQIYYGERSDYGGVKIPNLHTKLVVIDDELVITGSANLTEAAFGYNIEVLIIMRTSIFNELLRGF